MPTAPSFNSLHFCAGAEHRGTVRLGRIHMCQSEYRTRAGHDLVNRGHTGIVYNRGLASVLIAACLPPVRGAFAALTC